MKDDDDDDDDDDDRNDKDVNPKFFLGSEDHLLYW